MAGQQDTDIVPNFAAAWAAQARYYSFNDISLGKQGRTAREIVYPSVAIGVFAGCFIAANVVGVAGGLPWVFWVVLLIAFPLVGWGCSMLPRIEGLFLHQLVGPFVRHMLTRRTVLLGWVPTPSTSRRIRFGQMIELCEGSKQGFGRIQYTGPGTVTRYYPCTRGEIVYSGVDRLRRRKPVLQYQPRGTEPLEIPKVMVVPAGVTVEFVDQRHGVDCASA